MNSEASSKQVFRVTIFNQTLSIASSTSEAEFRHIADQVDMLMSMIASKSGTSDGTRVGVLASMHLADRLHQAERKLENAQDALEKAQAETNAVNAQLVAARVSVQSNDRTLELAKAQVAKSESMRLMVEDELRQVKNLLSSAQAESQARRTRISKDAGRLHTLLDEALGSESKSAESDQQNRSSESEAPGLFG